MTALPPYRPTALYAQCPDGTPPPCAGSRPAPVRAASVAVLYIAARDSADAYLADGLTEDVTTLLARRGELIVKASGSVRLAQRRQPGAAPRALGRTLEVRYVVQGTMRRAADRVRLNVQLVEAGSDVTVWGGTYDRTAQGLLDLPAELANEIAVRVGVSRTRARPVPVWQTNNPAALDHFRRGNHILASRSRFPEAFAEYQEAARLDPRFASAVARSAYTLALRRGYGGPDSLVPRALNLANAAVRLDSSSSDAWMALGYLRALEHPRTLAGVTDAFDRAVALDSANAEAWHQYGQVLAWLGDDVGAVRAVERAVALEPARAISLVDLGTYSLRDPARALILADSALGIIPGLANAWRLKTQAHMRLGQLAAALADADSLATSADRAGFAAVIKAVVLVRMGDSTLARELMRRAGTPAQPAAFFDVMVVLALGDTAAALDHLERAPATDRNVVLWWFLRQPEFDGLRTYPRFTRVYQDARPSAARAP